VDERNVPHDHPDSTHKAVQEALLSKVGIPPQNVLAIVENTPVDQVRAFAVSSSLARSHSLLRPRLDLYKNLNTVP
jgi:6-phosphogluconolactonase/glucosamine-6-phosphate isomerase/deaminase